MKLSIPLVALAVLALALPFSASAQSIAAVHAINGTDLGASKAFPVDIAVNGGCALTNFRFGDITGYIELGRGNFDIDISVSDGNCGNEPVLSTTVKLRNGDFKTVVAQLDANGAPITATYNDDQTTARSRNGRITFRHAAAAPSVDITLGKGFSNAVITASDLENGEEKALTLRKKRYNAYIAAYLSESPLVGPIPLSASPGMNTFIYAAGSLSNGTFELLVDVKPLNGQH